MDFKALKRRIRPIASAAFMTLGVPFLTPIVSLAVVRLVSAELWGQFVAILLPIQLAAHIANWGGREYLLRTFSQTPARIDNEWRIALLARLVILLPCAIFVMTSIPANIQSVAVVWLISLFVVQSHDSLVAYTKSFGRAAMLEASATLAIAGNVVLFHQQLNLMLLVMMHAAFTLLRAVLLTLYFRRWMVVGSVSRIAIQQFLLGALPFFLLGLTGMLQSRADVYVASILMLPHDLAQYQVLTTITGYAQSLPNIVLLPFIRALYRLDPATLPGLARKLALAGLLVLPPLVLAAGWLANTLYHFSYPLVALLAVMAAALPICWYLPQIYALYRVGRERMVLFVNSAGAITSCVLSLTLIPMLGITGGIVAAALAQWLMLGLYIYTIRAIN